MKRYSIYVRLLTLFWLICNFVNCRSANTPLRYDVKYVYDIEGVKYMEDFIGEDGVRHTEYLTRNGDAISSYEWKTDTTTINTIKNLILGNFIVNEFTEAQGNAILLLVLDTEKAICEIRIIRGITQGFNDELLRVTKTIENDLKQKCVDCKTPIVTPFPINIRDWIEFHSK